MQVGASHILVQSLDQAVNLKNQINEYVYITEPLEYINEYSLLIHDENYYIKFKDDYDVMKSCIDEQYDSDYIEDLNVKKKRLIHYVCQYSSPQIIKYVINKGIDFTLLFIINKRRQIIPNVLIIIPKSLSFIKLFFIYYIKLLI